MKIKSDNNLLKLRRIALNATKHQSQLSQWVADREISFYFYKPWYDII